MDVYKLADEVTAGLEGMEVPLRVAVMGCVVNGPGEAREADLGVASGNGKGQIFVKGEVIKTVPESKIVETLIEEAMKIAEQMEKDGVASGEPDRRRRRLTPGPAAPPPSPAGPFRPQGSRAARASPACGGHGCSPQARGTVRGPTPAWPRRPVTVRLSDTC